MSGSKRMRKLLLIMTSSKQDKMSKALNVSGIGKGSQAAEYEVTVPIAVYDQMTNHIMLDSYKAPVIPDSPIPALLGLETLVKHRAVINVFANPPELHFVGPGGIEMKLPPGTKSFHLERAPSGHLMLPVSQFAEYLHQEKVSKSAPREESLKPIAEPLHLHTTQDSELQ